MKSSYVILVVDDNPVVMAASTRILTGAGYEVAQAMDGVDALEKVRALRPSLVLLDMVLPDISGDVVLRRIRADQELADISVVLMSSLLISPDQQASGLDAGADGYITRPIAQAEFVARVRLHLRQHELTCQLRASEARLIAAQAVAKVGSWETDLATLAVLWSEETHRIFETDPATFTPSHQAFLEFIPPDDRRAVEQMFVQSLTETSAHAVEHRVVLPSGRVKVVEEHWRVIHDARGKPLRAIGTCQDITRRKQADEKLLERDALLRMAGRTARLGGWTIQLPERTLTWSDENCAIHDLPAGYQPTLEEGIAYFPPEYQAEVARYVENCEKHGIPYDFELPKITAKGRRIWVRSMGEAVRNAEGKIVRVQGAIQDITERKQAEDIVRQQDALLHIAGRVTHTGGWSVAMPSQRIFWTNDMFDILEYPQGQVPSLAEAVGLYPEPGRSAIVAALATCARDGTPFDLEVEMDTGRGRRIWVRVCAEAARHADRSIEAVHGALQDITERKQAEKGLALFRRLVEQSNDGIYVANAVDGDFIDVNESACRQLGYTRDELLRLRVIDINREFTTLPAWNEHLRVLQSEGSIIVEFTGKRKDGSSIPLEVSLRHVILNEQRYVLAAARDITERKAAEKALHEREAELRALAESMPQMVWMTRPDGWNIYFNQRWVEYTGLSLEESYGHGWNKPFHPDDQKRAWEAWQQAVAGSDYNVECRLRRADGRYRWMLIRGLPFRDLAGRTIKWMGTCTDIDDLKTSQRALQMLSRSNAALVHAKSEGPLLAEVCQIAVEVGGFRMAWVGYAQEEVGRSIVPQTWAGVEQGYLQEIKISWSEDLPAGQGPAGKAIRTGQAVVMSDLARDDTFSPWREAALQRGYRALAAVPLKDKARTFGVLVLFLTDVRDVPSDELRVLQELADNLAFGIISLRVRAERRLAREEMAQQAALIDQAQDAIIVLDLNHRISFWSRGAERLYGWTAGQAVGQVLYELLKIEHSAYAEADRLVREKREWTGERQKISKSHDALIVNSRWTLLYDDEGRPKSILAIDTDMTERKKLEAQFLRAQRMESIGTLAGGIAHDLNNLLSPVVMGIGLLKQLDPRPNVLEVITNIERSARRGADLVKQVLSFARGVEGARVALHLDPLLREIEAIVTKTFPKSISFQRECPADLWQVVGDPTQIQQVVLNLCLNARDAMPNGGQLTTVVRNVEVDDHTAAANRGAQVGRYLVIEVTDTGSGIPPENIDRIFEPFFTTKELGQGTGLGLSTALGIVRSHGGFLIVQSEPAKGSTFKVYLPASLQALPADTAERAGSDLPRGNGQMLLIVDDDATILDITKKTLEFFGYRVLVAQDGAQAIQLYGVHGAEIALVLTDMMMPSMDGPAVISALRGIDSDVRIIASSGLNPGNNGERAVLAGVSHFLSKPYSADVLLPLLKKVLTE